MATFPEDVRFFERYKLNRFVADTVPPTPGMVLSSLYLRQID
ncbi:uncharacterized protein CPUR_05799 [Claviceps purpurea 20.1]|uniref:Uncharacterized protein n=1 Tax=Claviceps purpurea (strain 20.1) TaxID=1111077 RepID=M1VWV7_CLAP2|nr:uncharacterized protein CPUR_05799 [Claviceps purpurea 20.1]